MNTNTPINLSHRADIRVSADRTFRAVLRSCRSTGASMPQALKRANEITLNETGIDMLQDLHISLPVVAQESKNTFLQFIQSWQAGLLPIPYGPCRSSQLYAAYLLWAKENNLETISISNTGHYYTAENGIKKSFKHFEQSVSTRVVTPIHENWSFHGASKVLKQRCDEFDEALFNWNI